MALSIPLPLLLGMIVVGLGVVLAALHRMGWSATATLDGPAAAQAHFALDHPEAVVTDTVVAADGGGALLALEDGRLGLVVALGDRFVVRVLGPGALSALRVDPDRLHLRLADVGFPHAQLVLAASPDRTAWEARLAACGPTSLTA